jgi:cell division protein FtsB
MTIQQAKEWFTLAVSVIAVVAGVIFWVQSTSDSKISNIEKDIAELRTDIRKIQQDNNEIIRIMGRLEGLIDK